MVFLFGVEIAVIFNQLTHAFFYFRPAKHKVVFGGNAATVNGNTFTVMPCITFCPV